MNDSIVVTAFDGLTWGVHGTPWARAVKSHGLQGAVIDFGIPPEGITKLEELGIAMLRPASTGCYPLDRVLAVLGAQPGLWLLCAPTYRTSQDTVDLFALAGSRLVCRTYEQRTFNLVFPISTIESRVHCANRIESGVVARHGGPLSAELLCGPSEQWALFAGLFRYCVECGFVESRVGGLENLVLNLFAVTFDSEVEVL